VFEKTPFVKAVSTRFLPWNPGFWAAKNPGSKAETGLKMMLTEQRLK
jgi:hypothetical protein